MLPPWWPTLLTLALMLVLLVGGVPRLVWMLVAE